jgi:DNA-binding NarL/FixJ family response regulator
MVHVFILSPSPAVRLGLRALLDASPGIRVSGDAADPESLRGTRVDVLVYAPSYGSSPGLEMLPDQFKEGAALLILTEEVEAVRQFVELPLRAWGILSPDATGEELAAAILALHEGFVLLDAVAAKMLIHFSPVQTGRQDEEVLQPLTERETEVLQLIVLGLANKQIAAHLKVSPHTVKFHISSIYNKLGVSNRTEAVRFGLRKGLVIL